MKVKKQKTDELVVALKQLKLTDRHSSFSIHTRTPRTCLSRFANEHSLRTRLTRSLSAVAPCLHHRDINNSSWSFSTTYPSCNVCDLPHNLGKRLTEPMINHSTTAQFSPFSVADPNNPVTVTASDKTPFILSVTRLNSTLPIDGVNQERSAYAVNDSGLNSSMLRRSIGTDLDQFYDKSQSKMLPLFTEPCGKTYTNPSALNQSQTTNHNGATGISLRSKFCAYHCSSGCYMSGVSRVTLPQLHLSRRLYSLIDHPCINLYHTCRYSSCSHMTLTSEWATAYTPRRVRQHNTRYRHSLGSSGSVTNFFSTATTTTANTEGSNSTEGYMGLPLSSGIPPDFSWSFTTHATNHENAAVHPNDLIHPTCSTSLARCRRNSDPERWQQQQVQQNNLKRAALEENVAYQGPQRTRRFSRSGPVSQKSTDIQASPSSPLPSPSLFSKSAFLPVRRAAQDGVRSVSDSGESNQIDAPTFVGLPQKNESSTFRFRAPILPCQYTNGTETLGLQGRGDCSTQDTGQRQLDKSVCGTSSFWSLSESRHINPSSKVMSPKVDVSNDSDTRPDGECVTSGNTSSGEIQSHRQCDTKLGSAPKELCQQSNCEDASGEGGEQSATMMSMMMTSDVSVSELAGYMEHMVHIPGRMSEMAQRMYI